MELGVFVAESGFANSQSPEVFGGLGDGLSSESNGQIARKC